MAEVWKHPTAEQHQLSELVQSEIVAVMNSLIREGIDPPMVLAGTASATADLLASIFGPELIGPWFRKQADLRDEHQNDEI